MELAMALLDAKLSHRKVPAFETLLNETIKASGLDYPMTVTFRVDEVTGGSELILKRA